MNKVPKIKTAPKVRFSGSMDGWMIDWVNEAAKKEDRSFSDMLSRLACDALKIKRAYSYPMNLTLSLINDYCKLLALTNQPLTHSIYLSAANIKSLESEIKDCSAGGIHYQIKTPPKKKNDLTLQINGYTFFIFNK